MAGHNLIRAIARINRVFKDKEGGLVVDYVGIAAALGLVNQTNETLKGSLTKLGISVNNLKITPKMSETSFTNPLKEEVRWRQLLWLILNRILYRNPEGWWCFSQNHIIRRRLLLQPSII